MRNDRRMRWLLILLMTTLATAQDWVVEVPAPSSEEMIQVRVLRGGPHPLVRPLLHFSERALATDSEGKLSKPVEATLLPHGSPYTTIPAGSIIQRFQSGEGQAVVYWEEAPTFRSQTSPHVPGTVASVTEPEGLKPALLKRLKALPTQRGRTLAVMLLPRTLPPGYEVQTATTQSPRTPLRAAIRYRRGNSFFQLDYLIHPPGPEPSKEQESFELYHHVTGGWSMSRTDSGEWTSPYLALPGRITEKGELLDPGFLLLTFSADFTPEQIKALVGELKRLH